VALGRLHQLLEALDLVLEFPAASDIRLALSIHDIQRIALAAARVRTSSSSRLRRSTSARVATGKALRLLGTFASGPRRLWRRQRHRQRLRPVAWDADGVIGFERRDFHVVPGFVEAQV
jgi:hypothetical protein